MNAYIMRGGLPTSGGSGGGAETYMRTINYTDWYYVGDGFYEYTGAALPYSDGSGYVDSDNDTVIMDIYDMSISGEGRDAWSLIFAAKCTTSNIQLFATEAPMVNFQVKIAVIRKAVQ